MNDKSANKENILNEKGPIHHTMANSISHKLITTTKTLKVRVDCNSSPLLTNNNIESKETSKRHSGVNGI